MPQHRSAATKHQQDNLSPDHSSLSCHRCRRLKRRCDRQYPCCTLCHQTQVECDYPQRRKERSRRGHRAVLGVGSLPTPHESSQPSADPSPRDVRSRPEQENVHLQLPELSELDILAASFLHPDHVILAQLETIKNDTAITKTVANLVGSISEIQATAHLFFESIHVWMPIVSRKKFQEDLLERLAFRRAESFLLVLALKLCSSRVTVAKSMLYRTVKQFYFDVESSGRLSVQVLQAAILIAVYELGQGIYPAVIISVGNCARIGILLGIDRYLTTWGPDPDLSWIELEERRRVWWMIIILDRFINLSDPKRRLVTPDPDPESYLPVDDGEWDRGLSKPEDAVKLRSSSQVHIGRFARFVHAAPLLSQALSRSDEESHNTAQLRRTILSLIHLGEAEGVTSKILFCTLNAACYSAVFALDNAHSPLSADNNGASMEESVTPETVYAIQHAIEVLKRESFQSVMDNHEKLAPFLIYMLYMALMICLSLKLNPPTALDITSAIDVLKRALQSLQSRWLVAGTYLLLAKRQEVRISLMRTLSP